MKTIHALRSIYHRAGWTLRRSQGGVRAQDTEQRVRCEICVGEDLPNYFADDAESAPLAKDKQFTRARKGLSFPLFRVSSANPGSEPQGKFSDSRGEVLPFR